MPHHPPGLHSCDSKFSILTVPQLLMVPGHIGVEKRFEHHRHTSLCGSVSERQAEQHQGAQPREVPPHAVGEELLCARISGAIHSGEHAAPCRKESKVAALTAKAVLN